MLFPLEKLLEGRNPPRCIAYNQTVAQALAEMVKYDYSQLPISDANGKIVGIISEQTVSRSYFHLKGSTDLLALTVGHCQEPAHTLELSSDRGLSDVLRILQDSYAVIITKDKKPVGILTDYDTTRFFREIAEDLITVQDIEETLRQYIENVLPDKPTKDAALVHAFGFDRRDPSRIAKVYEELSLSEHVQLIATDKNWEKFERFFEPKEVFLRIMNDVGKMRNQLAHFRGQLDLIQRDSLKRALNWMETRPKLNTGHRVPEIMLSDEVLASIETILAKRKYDRLAEWFAQRKEKTVEITLSFEEIEKLIGEVLPDSAKQHRSWWANDINSHNQSTSWLQAGWIVDSVDLAQSVVVFHRSVQAMYAAFFADVLQRLKKERPDLTTASAVKLQSWWSFSAGRSGFTFGWAFARQQVLRVELYIDMGDQQTNKAAFDCMERDRDYFEEPLGFALTRERLNDRRASRIYTSKSVKFDSPEQLEDSKQWAVTTMIKFADIFKGYIPGIEF